ncbi:MAG: VUT family protein [Propionibacteriaceae bacterium]|jgi:uncharacterized PurR-regulated membrane protein YhhQ (DUF165 family)|nr:VUT family protein [Propionibacteriaceae bacterium]
MRFLRSFLGLAQPGEEPVVVSAYRANLNAVMYGVFCAIYLGTNILGLAAFTIWDFGGGIVFTCGYDIVFFVSLYVLSDIFAEVFGYRATRITGILAMVMNIIVSGSLYFVNTYAPAEFVTMEGKAGGTSVWGWLPSASILMTLGGSIIFMLGDWVNDVVHRFLHRRHLAAPKHGYRKYISRTVGSSIAGRTFDAAVFSCCVAAPMMAAGLIDWGWGEPWTPGFFGCIFIGAVLLQVLLQVVIELVFSYPTYRLTSWLNTKVKAEDEKAGVAFNLVRPEIENYDTLAMGV